MYCEKCGTKRVDGESYCHNCGNVFGSRVKDKKKENKILKWIMWIIIAIVVIYGSLVIGNMIGKDANESERITQLEIENDEIKEDLVEQKNEFDETISKIVEGISSGKDDIINELEGVSDKLKEDITKLISSIKEDSDKKEEKD